MSARQTAIPSICAISTAMSLLCVPVLLGVICVVWLFVRFILCRHSTQAVKLADFDKIHSLLSPDLTVSLADQLRRRALANVRLKNAFQINSTFVEGDVAGHSAFVR